MSQATLPERPYVNAGLFSSHYLDERVLDREEWNCDESAEDAMGKLRDLYEIEGELVGSYGEDALIDNWIDEVLDVLGYGTQAEVTLPEGDGYVDSLLFETQRARREAVKVYLDSEETTDLFERGVGLVEAKQWGADFTERFSEQRPYYNASQQIKRYLGKTPESIQWGILTNGRKWRLYGTKEYEEQIYYEIDLPELLERGDLEAFKYFYVFFGPEALRELGETTFLDEVWSESETASQELGEDLHDNVFTALRVLGRGFVESNDSLDIDIDDDEALDVLKDQSLVLLYRLMFVLYAESRTLIHPDTPQAVDEYEENFSLDELRLDIHEQIGEVDEGFDDEFSNYSTTMWSRLEDLFGLIDEGEESLGIPPYNGGLFDREEHAFLNENEVSNRYLAEVIYRLSTTQNHNGRYVLADYGDLDTRHLGSVYEGLLEHQFRVAPEQYAAVSEDGGQVWRPATEVSVAEAVETVLEGGLYVVNDQGERKATGAYYTPDYVVTYIVEETVGPLVEEIRDDLVEQGFEPGTQEYLGPFSQRVTDLKILDPAMGSGHFLTRVTGYLAREVMEEVREVESEMGVAFDEQHIRREIAKECIYGVDLNGMAVELAKLSMWLETLAADRPLAFLDHHLKAGNSLVGSDITEVLSEENEENGGQLTLTQAFARVRQDTLEHVMELMADLLAFDNETLADVKSMEELYAEIREDPLYKRLFRLANVHTAEEFGVEVPEDAYERMAGAIEDEDDWSGIEGEDWFIRAQRTAEEQGFFHWELEFPAVFFDSDGEKLARAGFDAVVGNPPWIATAGRSSISATMDSTVREYLSGRYSSTNQQFDLYVAFYEKFVKLSSQQRTGIVVPDAILTREQNSHIRRFLLKNTSLSSIVHIGMAFQSVENGAVVLVTGTRGRDIRCGSIDGYTEMRAIDYNTIPQDVFKSQDEYRFLLYLDEQTRSILKKMERQASLNERVDISRGEEISKRADHLSSEPTESHPKAIIPGSAIQKYGFDTTEARYISPDQIAKDLSNYESPKLVFRQTAATPLGAFDDASRATIKSVYNIRVGGGVSELRTILAVLNSSLIEFYHDRKYAAYRSVFPQINQSTFKAYPVVAADNEELVRLTETREDATRKRSELTTDLLMYVGPFESGLLLPTVGMLQPTAEPPSPLHSTRKDLTKLKIGRVELHRESAHAVSISATARYKPDNGNGLETDTYGYTETDLLPAFRITDLTEREADLIEHFVPVAVEEAGGFANFRETATKTNSLIDRLKAIELPDPDDVVDDLENYLRTVERAEELDEKIRKTDDLIDEIVYELYGLSEEEIEIVEDAVR